MSEEPRKSDIGTDISLIGDEHVRRYQETNGEVGYIWNGVTALLFTYTGRKSGEKRTRAIICTKIGESYAIIASKGGAPNHPLWYLSLQENPEVDVQVKADKFKAIARTAQGAERAAIWAEAVKHWPNFDVYQSRTEREIPVVVLDPVRD